MKRNLLSVFALVLALSFSAFTTTRFADVYLVYENAGDQADIDSYQQESSASPISGANNVLAWIKVSDANSFVEQFEFDPIFDNLDQNPNGNLNDESEISGILEKKPS